MEQQQLFWCARPVLWVELVGLGKQSHLHFEVLPSLDFPRDFLEDFFEFLGISG